MVTSTRAAPSASSHDNAVGWKAGRVGALKCEMVRGWEGGRTRRWERVRGLRLSPAGLERMNAQPCSQGGVRSVPTHARRCGSDQRSGVVERRQQGDACAVDDRWGGTRARARLGGSVGKRRVRARVHVHMYDATVPACIDTRDVYAYACIRMRTPLKGAHAPPGTCDRASRHIRAWPRRWHSKPRSLAPPPPARSCQGLPGHHQRVLVSGRGGLPCHRSAHSAPHRLQRARSHVGMQGGKRRVRWGGKYATLPAPHPTGCWAAPQANSGEALYPRRPQRQRSRVHDANGHGYAAGDEAPCARAPPSTCSAMGPSCAREVL